MLHSTQQVLGTGVLLVLLAAFFTGFQFLQIQNSLLVGPTNVHAIISL